MNIAKQSRDWKANKLIENILVNLYSELGSVTVFSLIHITLVMRPRPRNGILGPKMFKNVKIDI